MKYFMFILILTVSSYFVLNAQPSKGDVGISIGIQKAHTDINIPYWIGDKTVLAPSFSFFNDSEKLTEFDIGASFRHYMKKEKLSPFISAGYMWMFYSPGTSNLSSIHDHVFGVSFGGEYFFDNQFSIGGEIQLNLSVSDENSNRFGNPGGHNFNTGSYLFASFYF